MDESNAVVSAYTVLLSPISIIINNLFRCKGLQRDRPGQRLDNMKAKDLIQ